MSNWTGSAGQSYPPPNNGGPAYGAPGPGGPQPWSGSSPAGPYQGIAPHQQPYSPSPYPSGPPMPPAPAFAGVAPKPGILSFRPQSVGDTLDVGFAGIRGNPGGTFGTALLGGLVVGAIVAAGVVVSITTANNDSVQPLGLVLSIVGALFGWATGFAVLGGLVHVFGQAVLGRRASAGASLGVGFRRALPLIALSLVTSVCAGVALVVPIALLAAADAKSGFYVVVVIVWALALLFFSVRLCLAAHVVVLEKAGPFKALARSWSLTRRRFWRTLGSLLLAYLLLTIISYVIQIILTFITVMFLGVGLSSVGKDDHQSDGVGASLIALMVIAFLIVLLMAVVTMLTYPFFINVIGTLYVDARIRDEGLAADLMQITQAFQPAPPGVRPKVMPGSLDFPMPRPYASNGPVLAEQYGPYRR